MSQRVVSPLESRDSFVYYEGHLASYPNVLVGKLVLNSKYLVFHIHEPRYAGVLQNPRLVSTGKVVAVQLNKILDAYVETGTRARKSRPNWRSKDDFTKKMTGERPINAHPGFLDDSERFSRLLVTVESDNGVEIAAFEMPNPEGWEKSLKTHLAKPA